MKVNLCKTAFEWKESLHYRRTAAVPMDGWIL